MLYSSTSMPHMEADMGCSDEIGVNSYLLNHVFSTLGRLLLNLDT